jgi:hypothetical protein
MYVCMYLCIYAYKIVVENAFPYFSTVYFKKFQSKEWSLQIYLYIDKVSKRTLMDIRVVIYKSIIAS